MVFFKVPSKMGSSMSSDGEKNAAARYSVNYLGEHVLGGIE